MSNKPDVNLGIDHDIEPTVTVYGYDFRQPIVLIDPDRGSGICIRMERADTDKAGYLREFARVLTAAADHLESMPAGVSSIWHSDQAKQKCDHAESMHGRCVVCGMTWDDQAAARTAATGDGES